jgi:hypothetical protein
MEYKKQHFQWNAKADSKEHADALASIWVDQIKDFSTRWAVYMRRAVEVYYDTSFTTTEKTWYVHTRFTIDPCGNPGMVKIAPYEYDNYV